MNKRILIALAAACTLAACDKTTSTSEGAHTPAETASAPTVVASAPAPAEAKGADRRHEAAAEPQERAVVVPRESSAVRAGPPARRDEKSLLELNAAADSLVALGQQASPQQRNELLRGLAHASYAYDTAASRLQLPADSQDQVVRHLKQTGGLSTYLAIKKASQTTPTTPEGR